MSEEEKFRYIGAAADALGAAKRELAFVTEKRNRVLLAYRTFAYAQDRWLADGGKVMLAHPKPNEVGLGEYLLTEADLAALIQEHSAAQAVVEKARAHLSNLGVNVE